MKPTKKQCEILDKMIRNHKDRVLTSYMDGDTLIVETEYKKYSITKEGKNESINKLKERGQKT